MIFNFNDKKGVISSVILEITLKNEEDEKKYVELMNKLTDEFIKMQLYEGDVLAEYGEKHKLYSKKGFLFFNHSKGIALIRPRHYGNKKDNGFYTSISPEITITDYNGFKGLTFDTGLFSDVYINYKENSGTLFFTTRDILSVHNVYLHWVLSKLESKFKDYKLEEDYKPLHRDHLKLHNLLNPICLEFDDYICRNKSKRIDSLIYKGVHIKDYIKQNIKYNCCVSEKEVYKCCCIYGKPYKQVKNYMDKIL